MRILRKTLISFLIIVFLIYIVPVKADCCTYSVDKITPSITTLMKGSSYIYKYTIKNTCTTTSTISFHFTNLTRVTITPSSFNLNKGISKTIEVKFVMPPSSATNSNVSFSFKVSPTCGTVRTISFSVKAGPSCSFQITKNDTPATITSLEKGKGYSYYYTLKNTSSENVTFTFTKDEKIDFIANLPTTLGSGATRLVVVRFVMPVNALTSSSVTFSFQIVTNCRSSQTITFTVKALAVCCNFNVTQTTTAIQSLGKGFTYTYSYKVDNLCSDSRNFTTVSISNIVSITPATFSIQASGSKVIQVKFLMPPSVSVGNTVLFSFSVNADCGTTQTGNQKIIDFYVNATSICCNFTVTKKTAPEAIQYLKIGSSYTYEYTIKNTCTNSQDKITFNLSNVSYITTITPNSFTLNPGESKTVSVIFTMPPVSPNTNVNFSYKVLAGCNNEPKIITFHAKATRAV